MINVRFYSYKTPEEASLFFLLNTYFKNFVTEENNREGVHEKREKYDREYFFCKALATALNFVSATSKCLYVRFS